MILERTRRPSHVAGHVVLLTVCAVTLLFLVLVGTWLVPFQVTMIPNYVLVSRLGWLDKSGGAGRSASCQCVRDYFAAPVHEGLFLGAD